MSEQLLQQLKKHEGKWVALFGPEDHFEIVAAGEDAVETTAKATRKGYTETTLLKVLPLDVAYVPLA